MAADVPQPARPPPGDTGSGLAVIRRLHRMVRSGYRPWLGYDAASGGDTGIHLRRKDNTATLHPDGTVTFAAPVGPTGQDASAGQPVIAGHDADAFDAAFPPNMPNKRNLVRRLYEIGFGSW